MATSAQDAAGTAQGADREAADPHVLPVAEADLLLRDAAWHRFAVIGDSLAEGLGESVPGYLDSPWTDRVADALRRHVPDLAFLNLGLRNLRAAEVREQQLEAALEFGPDLVSVVCGGNDMMAPDWAPAAVEAELDALVAPFRSRGADVFLFTIQDITKVFPPLAGSPLRERIHALNERTRAVAERHGAMVVDMACHPTHGDRESFSSDMLHASMRGHAVLASATITCLSAHLATKTATSG